VEEAGVFETSAAHPGISAGHRKLVVWLEFAPYDSHMRRMLAVCGLIGLLGACRVEAQNSDLALLAGITGPRGRVVGGPNLVASGSVGASGQINYAWQAWQRALNLYIELPLVFTGNSSGTATTQGTVSYSSGGIFFTPGARIKVSPQSRVSFYAALGGGIGTIGTTQVTAGATASVVSKRNTSPALDFGGGLDFRLTRLLSLRADARDFVTRSGFGLSSGRNRWMFLVGVAFHF
jgi:hypothetical protein